MPLPDISHWITYPAGATVYCPAPAPERRTNDRGDRRHAERTCHRLVRIPNYAVRVRVHPDGERGRASVDGDTAPCPRCHAVLEFERLAVARSAA